MASRPTYPFVPKSNRWLEPGQFWALRLRDGRFGCGRVMAVPALGGRTGFLAGIANWIGEHPPTAEDLAGHAVLEQGTAHFRTILETGGEVLGHRPLDADDIVAQDPDDDSIGAWGLQYIALRAERLLT